MRTLDTKTLDAAALHYAVEFMKPDVKSLSGRRFVGGASYVMQDFYNFDFKDEFEYLLEGIRGNLGANQLARFNRMADFDPRHQDDFEAILAEKLAIDPNGEHIAGKIGTVERGNRVVGHQMQLLKTAKGERTVPKNLYWPVYAGEENERASEAAKGLDSGEGGIVDPLPLLSQPLSVSDLVTFALNTRISNAVAIVMCDGAVDALDGGTLGAVLEGRTTPRPSNVDDAVTGTLLFALNANTGTTFGAAADAAPGAIATAGTIDDDTSANATGTLLYVRASSSSVADTPLLDIIEGEAGTAGADFNFNTLAIVSAATVSLTSWTVTQPEA